MCSISQRRHVEVGRVKCHRHEFHVLGCFGVQRRYLEVGRVKASHLQDLPTATSRSGTCQASHVQYLSTAISRSGTCQTSCVQHLSTATSRSGTCQAACAQHLSNNIKASRQAGRQQHGQERELSKHQCECYVLRACTHFNNFKSTSHSQFPTQSRKRKPVNQTEPTHTSAAFSLAGSLRPNRARTGVKPAWNIRTTKSEHQRGRRILKIPGSRLAEADSHSGQDGIPSLVAVPPDPPSGSRWQTACHYVVCLSVPGAQAQRSETRYPVARVLFMYGYRSNTAQTTRNRKPNMSRTHQMRRL